MKKDVKRAKDFLDYELKDGPGEFGGISYIGETLENFIAETEIDTNTAMRFVNADLKRCGIAPIPY